MAGLLKEYKNQFILQLLVILFGSVGLSFFIARLVSQPIHMAFHDSLTGLNNRHAFEDEISRRLEQKDRSFGLMMIDLDNFKCVNDELGHGEGDRILKIAAATIDEVIGADNFAARVGGDEFVVLVDMKNSPNVEAIANHLLQTMNERMDAQLSDEKIRTSISIGVVVATETDTFESLYKKADMALYESKDRGKNQFNFYESAFS
ncbi:GGDEF domain-containing protein [Sporosarcina thermotolerans]|nr:GGDEF domain-containing protein [Sporosarcina thermotolerans]WHT47698.1 GGDEF domain-containing protein [Sporosarcina thermotolerans]